MTTMPEYVAKVFICIDSDILKLTHFVAGMFS